MHCNIMALILRLLILSLLLIELLCFKSIFKSFKHSNIILADNYLPDLLSEYMEDISIISIIKHYIPDIKEAGQQYQCLCPFHDDNNPSLSINNEKGLYHCFSCNAGGNTIKFVMDFEKMNFPEAMEQISYLSGLPLPPLLLNRNR